MAHWVFMPKYLESQFRLSASKSSFVSGRETILIIQHEKSVIVEICIVLHNLMMNLRLIGTVGILCNALGVLLSGVVISKYKPPPRLLAGWTVLVELIEVFGYASYAFMGCEEQKYHGHWNNGHMSVSI